MQIANQHTVDCTNQLICIFFFYLDQKCRTYNKTRKKKILQWDEVSVNYKTLYNKDWKMLGKATFTAPSTDIKGCLGKFVPFSSIFFKQN